MEETPKTLTEFNFQTQDIRETSEWTAPNVGLYNEKVFAKNLSLSIRLKELQTDNNYLRSEVIKLYAILRENAENKQNSSDTHDTLKALEIYKKSEQETSNSLDAINAHINHLMDRINTVQERRIAIEQRLPRLGKKYEQTLSELLQRFDLSRKREKNYQQKVALNKNLSHLHELLEQCFNEMSNVHVVFSQKQNEITDDKSKFFDVLDNMKCKLETLLKTQQEQIGKLSTAVENKKNAEQYGMILQENQELKESLKNLQEGEKLLRSNNHDLTKRLQNSEAEKNKLQSELNEVLEERETLKNERSYEARRANKFEQMTVEINSDYKNQIKNSEILGEKNKLLEARITELQKENRRLRLHESQNLNNPHNNNNTQQTKNWNASDNVSVRSAASFTSITFSREISDFSQTPAKRQMKYCGNNAAFIAYSQSKKQRTNLFEIPREVETNGTSESSLIEKDKFSQIP